MTSILPDWKHLAKQPLFKNMNEAELQSAFRKATLRNVPEGEFFFFQEDPANGLFILRFGKVKLLQITPDGQQIVLGITGQWQPFGVIALVPDAVYPVSAQAIDKCQALRWDRAALQEMAAGSLNFSLNVIEHLANHVRDLQGRVRELSLDRVERRLARLLLRLARQMGKKTDEGVLIDMAISRQDIAEMSGTTLFTVSRTFSRWEKAGIIDVGRERIVIKFPHGLVQIAEDLPEH